MLRAIVQRARSLLGTDIAYLSLNDPVGGDTYMRVTEGRSSARFQQLRLGMGEGLGGLVAQTARPYVTDDYFKDDRFQHTRAIDAGVQDEGLVAILGVPLMLGTQVIGVLFAADRRATGLRPGTGRAARLLRRPAAVAIDTANALAETRSALDRLGAGQRDHPGPQRRDRTRLGRPRPVAELVLRGGGVHDVAAAVSEVLDAARSSSPSGGTPMAVEAARADGHAVRHGDDWVAAVAAGGELLGALVLRGHPGLDPVDQRTLERAAMVTSLLLLARRSAPRPNSGCAASCWTTCSTPRDRDPRLLRERAARLHADLDGPHVVLAARTDAPGTDTAGRGPTTGRGGGDRGPTPVVRRLPSRRHPPGPGRRPRRRRGPAAAARPRRHGDELARRTAKELGPPFRRR